MDENQSVEFTVDGKVYLAQAFVNGEIIIREPYGDGWVRPGNPDRAASAVIKHLALANRYQSVLRSLRDDLTL